MLGILLFLPVPIVLWLYTRMPLGPLASLGAGAVLMLTHPLYARPFALHRSRRRCLWCGGAVAGSEGDLRREAPDPGVVPGGAPVAALLVREPRGVTTWSACRETHREEVTRVLRWAERRSAFLRVLILGAIAVLFAGSILAALRSAGPIETSDTVAFFRLVVAVAVLPLGWLSTRAASTASSGTADASSGAAEEPIRTPFPVHIQALIGTWAVLWLFRLIGLLWLVQGIVHFLRRGGA